MAVTIPLGGSFNLTVKLKRVGAAGDAIAGISFSKDGYTWHNAVWFRIVNADVGVTYSVTALNITLNDIKDINPIITTIGTYNGLGVGWNGYSGSPVEWGRGTIGGKTVIIYRAGTGSLVERQNEIPKSAELIVISAAAGSEIVDWYLS